MAYDQDDLNEFAEEKLLQGSQFPWGLIGTAAPIAAIGAGFIPTGKGKRVWDTYHNAIRHIENLSPQGLLRTFHLSEIISPLAAPGVVHFSPLAYGTLFQSRGFKDYLSKITGVPISKLERLGVFKKGLEWKKTGRTLGTLSVYGGPSIAENVAMLSTGYRGRGHIFEWFAQVTGARKPSFLRDIVKDPATAARAISLPIAAQGSIPGLVGKFAHGLFSSALGRMNLLLQSPMELRPMQELVKKIPFLGKLNLKLGVKRGTALQMAARYAGKAGLLLAGYHAIKYTDYLRRDYGPVGVLFHAGVGAAVGLGLKFRGRNALIGAAIGAGLSTLTSAREGLIPGAADLYATTRVKQAQFSDLLGLSSGARRSEDLFPGITKPGTLLAFAGVGAAVGYIKDYVGYLSEVKRTYAKRAGGVLGPFRHADIYEAAEESIKEQRQLTYDNYVTAAQKQRKGFSKLTKEFISYQADPKGWLGGTATRKGGMAGIAGFGILSTIGSLIAGDFAGALVQGASTVGAAALQAKGKGSLALLAMIAPFLLRREEDPEKLKRIYRGEELVEVKAGRFWEMGRTAYEGGRPRFRPHRVAMMKAHPREAALYGDESTYWETDPFASPFKFLWDPYARERAMWEQGYRFPVSATPFEEFPIVGPILAATVGRILKPPKFMGTEYWMPEQGAAGTLAPEGYANLPPQKPITRTGVMGTIGEQIYNITEAVGLPGFAFQSIKERLTGSESFFPRDQYATPSLVSGARAGYWSLDLGGAALLSEVYRRYFPHPRSDVTYRNPLPTNMPSWLPHGGADYYLDFGRSDIYTQVDEPWARLPGKGLEALNPELKGVSPENYSPFWRFKVLADLASWSKEYRQYNRMMTQMVSEGRLTPEQMLEVDTIRNQVARAKKKKEFDEYKYDMSQVRKERVRITEEIEPGVYLTDKFGAAPITLAGTNVSMEAQARLERARDASLSETQALHQAGRKRTQMSDFLRQYAYPGAELDVYIHQDPSHMINATAAGGPEIPAVITSGGRNINLELIERGYAEREEEPGILDEMAGVSAPQRLFGRFWEKLMHGAETPLESFTPFAPVSKFIHQRTAFEDYQRTQIYGKEVALWQHPIKHFLAPGLSTTFNWLGWKGVPKSVQQRWMVQEYFDRLEYIKWKNQEEVALARGEGEAAAQYAGQAARTTTGADPYSSMQAYLAVPKGERDYFREFIEAPTANERRKIASLVSPQMRRVLEAQWLQKGAEAAELRGMAGIASQSDMALMAGYRQERAYYASQQRTKDIEAQIAETPTPGPNWVGWSRGLSMRDIQVKTIDSMGEDVHSYGFWRSDVRKLEQMPYVEPISMAPMGGNRRSTISPPMIRRLYKRLFEGSGKAEYINTDYRSDGRFQTTINSPGYDRLDRFLRDPGILTF